MIADDSDPAPDFVRDERQNVLKKPGEAKIIRVICAGDDDEIVPAGARRDGRHGGIDEFMAHFRSSVLKTAASSSLRCERTSAPRIAASSICSISSNFATGGRLQPASLRSAYWRA